MMGDTRTVGLGGQVIEAARRAHGFTYATLAEAAGLSYGYVHDVCTGRRALGVRAALLLGATLGLDARSLLYAQVDAELTTVQAGARSRSTTAATTS